MLFDNSAVSISRLVFGVAMIIRIDDIETLLVKHFEISYGRCGCSHSWPCHSIEYLLAQEVKDLRLENGNLRTRVDKLDTNKKVHRKKQENVRRRKTLFDLHVASPQLSQENLARRLGFSQSWFSRHLSIAIQENKIHEQ